ncbi:MAG: DUF2924 domain-containing protein [Candidatus Sulfotelmatobacter sp.]
MAAALKKEPPPEIRKDLMLRVIAHRLQEQAFDGLSDAGCRRLRQLAGTFEADPNAVISNRPPIKAGTRLSVSGGNAIKYRISVAFLLTSPFKKWPHTA